MTGQLQERLEALTEDRNKLKAILAGMMEGVVAVDPEELLKCCPELVIVEGNADDFLTNRRACIIGEGLSKSYAFQVGDRVPLLGAIFPHPDGADVASAACEGADGQALGGGGLRSLSSLARR